MKLILCGDVVPTEATAAAFERGDVRAVFGGMVDEFGKADAVVVNLECALTESQRAIIKCGPNLKGAPSCASTLKAAGITHAGLANNHIYDFGQDGLTDTWHSLETAGISHFGTGVNWQAARQPVYIRSGGMTACIYAVCEHEYSYATRDRAGANPFEPFTALGDVRRYSQGCDLMVVMYHGGKEQCEYPSPRLRSACRALIDAGADIVLTQHSHCVGCREQYAGGEIVYGQGNFCFVTHQDHPHWRSGLALAVDFDSTGRELSYIPLCTNEHGVDIAQGEQAQEILRGFEARSAQIVDERNCEALWRKFCESVRPWYVAAARDAFADGDVRQVFPHYLDCEAHLDVWKTLFETWHAQGRDY